VCEGADVSLGDGLAVFEAKQVLQKNLQRHRQARNVAQSVLRCSFKAVIDVRLGADGEGFAGFETVERRHVGITLSGYLEIVFLESCGPPAIAAFLQDAVMGSN